MVKNIFRFDLDGKQVLGFDTGLDAQAFAQAKMAQFITQNGFLVFPDGRTQPWKAVGVYENPGKNGNPESMIVWGPSFPGESLDSLLRASINDKALKDKALDAVRYWLGAQASLEDNAVLYPGASGVLINMNTDEPDFPEGTILFPPERLVKRTIEAGGDDEALRSRQWVHPYLKGKDSVSFSAAAMAYTIFNGNIPFTSEEAKNEDLLRQDIREGVYIPLRLAVPGLDKQLVQTITAAMEPVKPKGEPVIRPTPETIKNILGDPGCKDAASFITPVAEEEKTKIKNELEQYTKKRNFTVKTRRFVIRNTTIIVICIAALIGAGLMVRGYFVRMAEKPNTRGMTPVEVVTSYYGSFEKMDHEMMEACIYGKKAKLDIDMVVNLYVLTRTQMAYEPGLVQISPQQWVDNGMPQTNSTVFGVTDLVLRPLGGSESQGEIIVEAAYKLWIPYSFSDDFDTVVSTEDLFSGNYVVPPAYSVSTVDRLTLTMVKDAWRITVIDRRTLR